MKVCMVTSTYPRYEGDVVPAFVHDLAKNIVKQGIEVHVVSPHHVLSKSEEDLEQVRVHRFRYMMPAKLEFLTGGAGMPPKLQESFAAKMEVVPFLVGSFFKSLCICKKYKIDVIHAHWFFPSGLIGVFLKKLIHRPLVVTGYGVEFFLTIKRYRLLSFLLRWIAANADECVFISSAVRKAAESVGVHGSIIVPYGVDAERFLPLTPNHQMVETLKRKYHICKKKVILTLGRLVARKGINYLIEAMHLILKDIPDAVLLIAGDGPERKSLQKRVHELKLENYIKFLGNVVPSELPFLYNVCDLFVLPSVVDAAGDQEGFGIVLCEAMACEKPVIGTRLGGILDIINDGENGILVEQKSVKELSRAVLDVLGDQKLAEKLGNRGRISAKRKFSFEPIARTYVSIYTALLKQETKRRTRAIGRVGNDAQDTEESLWHSR